MKSINKIIFSAMALLSAATFAGAQNMYDAINFSQNDYLGSAKSMALGNAVTALGGDLGTIGINPAGSAVSNYSQLVFTPGLSISAVGSSYSPVGETKYGGRNNTSHTMFTMPNVGMSLVYETGRKTGVVQYTFAFVSNTTNQYNYSAAAFGSNSQTSKIAEFASAASGYPESVLRNYNSFDNSDIPWDVLTAYQGGMFGSYGTDGQYVGVTEALSADGLYHYVPGALSQYSAVSKAGSKNDMVLNFGMNISEKLFLGMNLGIPTARYRYTESFRESAVNPGDFSITFNGTDGVHDTYFKSGAYNYYYDADITGIYAKFGAIYVPTPGLRIGATIQTPTAYTISETWRNAASATFDESSFDDSQASPEGEYTYCLKSPYSVGLGVAYTLPGKGLVSVDYEMMDYSVMRFREVYDDYYYYESDKFADVNDVNRNFAGLQHMLRIGAEYKVNPAIAVRAGFNLITSPERHWTNDLGQDVTATDYLNDLDSYWGYSKSLVRSSYYSSDNRMAVSAGVGYSSPGSFFADFALKCNFYPDTTFSPYYDYDNYDAMGTYVGAPSPKVLNDRKLINAALTIGWRF